MTTTNTTQEELLPCQAMFEKCFPHANLKRCDFQPDQYYYTHTQDMYDAFYAAWNHLVIHREPTPSEQPAAERNAKDAEIYELKLMLTAQKQEWEKAYAIGMQCQAEINSLREQAAMDREAVAEIVECPVMGQQTVREIDGRWRFLDYGTKLYAHPPAREGEAVHQNCCDTPNYCSSVRRCTAMDAHPPANQGQQEIK
jgi:hypothetical protein